jgi:pimeloyl-ACP methyl ester carboxylesterase
VLEEAGGSALYGHSGGAALALEAAASGLPVRKLALWEPPYILDATRQPPLDHVEQLEKMIAEGRRGDAAAYFLREVVRAPAEFVAQARTQPWWAAQEALAHTLAYDARILGDYALPTGRAESVRVPTLVLAGGGRLPVDEGHRPGARQRAAARSDADVGGTGPRQRRPDRPGARTEGVLRMSG